MLFASHLYPHMHHVSDTIPGKAGLWPPGSSVLSTSFPEGLVPVPAPWPSGAAVFFSKFSRDDSASLHSSFAVLTPDSGAVSSCPPSPSGASHGSHVLESTSLPFAGVNGYRYIYTDAVLTTVTRTPGPRPAIQRSRISALLCTHRHALFSPLFPREPSLPLYPS